VMIMRMKNVPTVQGFQTLEHVARDGTRTYYERSLQWMSWYLGPIALTAAIIGAGILVTLVLRGRWRDSVGALFLFGPATVMYLWRASAIPDHVWVTRRFLPAAFPLILLMTFWLVVYLSRDAPQRVPRIVPATAAIVIGVAALIAPIAALAPVAAMTDQRGSLDAVKGVCTAAGPNAAFVALKSSSNLIDGWVPQTLRNWCGVPTAAMRIPDAQRPRALHTLAQQWQNAGRQLWVIAGDSGTVTTAVPGAAPQDFTILTRDYLERRLLGRPSKYVPHTFHLVIARVP
jgi:hypothetical protein